MASPITRRAEIQQHWHVFFEQQNIVRRDIAVKHVFLMDYLKRLKQRPQQLAQPGFVRRCTCASQPAFERFALVMRHHHVSRAVRFPEAIHLDQRGMIEARQQARFIDETLQTELEGFAMAVRAHRHRHALRTCGEVGGIAVRSPSLSLGGCARVWSEGSAIGS